MTFSKPVSHGTYIEFRPVKRSDITHEYWQVHAKKDNALLGGIVWFPRWKKYIFCPSEATIYEEVCLREIAGFIEGETRKVKDPLQKHLCATGRRKKTAA